MRKLIIVTVLFCFAMTGTCIALEGRPGQMKMPPGPWWRMPDAARKLQLNNDEKQQLDRLYKENRRTLIELKSRIERERFDLEEILEQETFGESAAMAQLKKLQDARTELATERFRFLVKVRLLLGLERFQNLKTVFRDRRKKGDNDRRRRPDKAPPWQEKKS